MALFYNNLYRTICESIKADKNPFQEFNRIFSEYEAFYGKNDEVKKSFIFFISMAWPIVKLIFDRITKIVDKHTKYYGFTLENNRLFEHKLILFILNKDYIYHFRNVLEYMATTYINPLLVNEFINIQISRPSVDAACAQVVFSKTTKKPVSIVQINPQSSSADTNWKMAINFINK